MFLGWLFYRGFAFVIWSLRWGGGGGDAMGGGLGGGFLGGGGAPFRFGGCFFCGLGGGGVRLGGGNCVLFLGGGGKIWFLVWVLV